MRAGSTVSIRPDSSGRHGPDEAGWRAPDDRTLLLSARIAGRRHEQLALGIVAVLFLVLLAALPIGSDQPLQGTENLLPAYAAAVLLIDVIVATLLLAQFAVHHRMALLVLAVGYLVSGLTVVPWLVTFPGVFAENGLLGAGLQTTAVIAATRRLCFPLAVLGYAILEQRRVPVLASPQRTRLLIVLATLGSVLLTVLVSVVAVAGERFAPQFMTGPLAATATWMLILYGALLMSLLAGLPLLLRRRRSLLDLWLLVTLAAFLSEIVLLGFVGAGVRFSAGWWIGRVFGLVSVSVVMLALLAETTALHARLLQSLLVESRAKDARATMLEALSAALAHELNQPLAGIVTSADAAIRWLDRPQPDLQEVRARLDRIATEGHAAAAIITGVRQAFAKRPPRRDLIDPAALVQGAVKLIAAEARLAGVSITVELDSDLPPIQGDAVPLRQALLNLLANAQDAVAGLDRNRRTIHVACMCQGNGISISVTDHGTGLVDAARLFDPFYSTKHQGMGLGLMICRMIVEAHGGQVTAQANQPTGARFEIRLPAVQPPAAAGSHG